MFGRLEEGSGALLGPATDESTRSVPTPAFFMDPSLDSTDSDSERPRSRLRRTPEPPQRRRELVARALERMVFDRIARAEEGAGRAGAAINEAEGVIWGDIGSRVSSADDLPGRGPRTMEQNTEREQNAVIREPQNSLTGATTRLRDHAAQLDASLGQISRLFDALARVRREIESEVGVEERESEERL